MMKINSELLREFEHSINTINPEKGKISINILGYGEISLVFELITDSSPIAYKRLPIFDTEQQVRRHIMAYENYNKILDKLEFNIPNSATAWFKSEKGPFVLYCAQEKVPTESIGNKIIHQPISVEEIELFVSLILKKMYKIWAFNEKNKKLKIGLDGQISNWAIKDYHYDAPKVSENTELIYLDTSTPMFRIKGVDAMEPTLFLKSAPFFLRWLLKSLFLEDVVGRYYDFRSVIIDFLANFFKEQRSELIPILLKLVNRFLSHEAKELKISSIAYKEIYDYYEEDKQIWTIFQNTRRLDRYIQTKLLRRKYDFYLPPKIER